MSFLRIYKSIDPSQLEQSIAMFRLSKCRRNELWSNSAALECSKLRDVAKVGIVLIEYIIALFFHSVTCSFGNDIVKNVKSNDMTSLEKYEILLPDFKRSKSTKLFIEPSRPHKRRAASRR